MARIGPCCCKSRCQKSSVIKLTVGAPQKERVGHMFNFEHDHIRLPLDQIPQKSDVSKSTWEHLRRSGLGICSTLNMAT